jgi:membrane-bound ClpP family serine protease
MIRARSASTVSFCPGGDALASDLMWRQIRRAAGDKPLVATMGDVAASGGYYMAMAAPTVVAHPLTITGSIGVVTGKLNAAELFEKVRALVNLKPPRIKLFSIPVCGGTRAAC